MSGFEMDDAVAGALTARHAAAADGIIEAGEAVPLSIDAGLAGGLVAGILAGTLTTALRLAEVSAGTADLVRDVEEHFDETESQVADGLRDLRAALP